MMICYRDIAFCDFWESCKNGDSCPRKLDDNVIAKAQAWWGSEGEPPVMRFSEKPRCFVEK